MTGPPGSGKTTLIKQIAHGLSTQLDLKGGGFYTEEIRKAGSRRGFLIVTLEGEKRILAHTDIQSPNRVGKYGVDVQALEEVGVSAVEEATKRKEVVVIDEIGKMELFSAKFKEAVVSALNGNSMVLATIGQVDHPFIRDVKRRQDIYLLEINRGNRDCMKTKILDSIRETLKE